MALILGSVDIVHASTRNERGGDSFGRPMGAYIIDKRLEEQTWVSRS